MMRSLLFVPVLNERLVQRAGARGADVIVLDLEAAVPAELKTQAREQLATAVPSMREQCVPNVAVRVNLFEQGAEADIAAACAAGADTLVLPMATSVNTKRAAQLAGAGVQLIALIEDPRAVMEALAIAEAADSVIGLGLGVEDYATQMGTLPTPQLLVPAAFQVIQAARAAKIEPLVVPDTIADYTDIERFHNASQSARALGASGGFCIHPSQVAVLNQVFTPDAAEVEQARRIVEVAEQAREQGLAIASIDGQMIDAPIEERARALLARAEQC
jgi:citrate lyase subunit beta/citryl-CoA lyase